MRHTLLAAEILCVFTHLGIATPPANSLDAYDCTIPVDITDTSFHIDSECTTKTPADEPAVKQFQLLHEEQYRTIRVKRCQIERTRLSFFCGKYDHQTYVPELSEYNLRDAPSIAECGKWHSTKSYTNNWGHEVPLRINRPNSIHQYLTGDGYVDNSGPDWGQYRCIGAKTSINGRELPQTVTAEHLQITLTETDMRIHIATGAITIPETSTQLPCTANDNGCRTQYATYTWTYDDDYCTIKLATTFAATVQQIDDNQIITSTDDTLIRLVKTKPLSRCGRVIYATNYQHTFLYDASSPDLFTDKTDPTQTNLFNMIANRDDYLYHELVDKLQKQFQTSSSTACKANINKIKRAFWLTFTSPGFSTYMAGNGTFVTPAGEVLYSYKCRQTTVVPAPTSHCFDALPVYEITSNYSISTNTLWYLEPITHKLTTIAVQIPCSKHFMPKYQTLSKSWLMMTPAIMKATPPKSIKYDLQDYRSPSFKTIDFTSRGLYSKADIDKLQEYLAFPKKRDALTYQLTRQIQTANYNKALTPFAMFPDFMGHGTSLRSRFLSAIVKFFSTWGAIASIFMGIYTLTCLIITIVRTTLAINLLRSSTSLCKSVFWALCPDIYFRRRDRTGKDVEAAIPLRVRDNDWGTLPRVLTTKQTD